MRTATNGYGASGLRSMVPIDPLDLDDAGEGAELAALRARARIALVASETATRFAEAGVAVDPMAWMMTPRRMFDGASALEACGERQACLRAVVLHGIDEGLDADPGFLDSLLDEEDVAESGDAEPSGAIDRHGRTSRSIDGVGTVTVPFGAVGEPGPRLAGPGRARLFTAVICHEDGDGFVQAFSAMVAPSSETLVRALRERYGEAAATGAVVREGLIEGSALVDALVSPALAHVLEQVAAAPDSPLAAGLDLRVEQRFRS